MPHTYFFVEMTDTYGGEANYCWVKRFIIKSVSMRGAVQSLALRVGSGWKCTLNTGDFRRYDSNSGLTCFFIEEFDEDNHNDYRYTIDDREA